MYISNLVLNYLSLDQVWWLVAPHNPLKNKEQLNTIQKRLLSTHQINKNHKIKPQALELKIGTKFTYDTIKKLQIIMPRVSFFWIMGADNLYTMDKWYNWKKIFYLCPIIVVNRNGFYNKALYSKPAQYFWKNKLSISELKKSKDLPVWSFLNIRPNLNSSTNLRKNIG